MVDIVLRAIASTITIPVAADEAAEEDDERQRLLPRDHRQGQDEGVGIDPGRGSRSSPPIAIGRTKMLIASR